MKIQNSISKQIQDIFNARTIYWALVATIIIGFVTNMDYQYRSGCFTTEVPFLSKMKFFYSLTSLGLLALGYSVSLRWQTNSILIFELLFWAFRGLIYSGAFESIWISTFFIVCFALRIALILKLYKAREKDLPAG